MARLLIAIFLGIALSAGASVLAVKALTGVADGKATQGTLYQYGTR
jgi:hypothetical protein